MPPVTRSGTTLPPDAPAVRPRGPLVADRLTVRYADLLALDSASLMLAPGTFAALTGASGAGKSTLLWALAGALPPTSGTVTYADRPLPDRPTAARAGVAMIPQGNALVTPLTGLENVLVPLLALGIPAPEARERAHSAIAAVGLAESGTHLVEELSGGQQQRVAVARGLAQRAEVLLADEPTSDLDATTRGLIVALLAAEARAGAIVLMATHDAWCAERADVEYHLDEGRLQRRPGPAS